MPGLPVSDQGAAPAAARGEAGFDAAVGSGSFVGRGAELATLQAAAARAAAGRGGIVLVTGESGIGKTRLVHEAAVRAEALGARVLVGRCHEGLPAYRPWIDAIGSCVLELEAEQQGGALGSAATEIAMLVDPGMEPLAEPLTDPSSQPRLKPAQTRFRLFDGIATLLCGVAERRPIVLVLDDLQSADRPSLQLLGFVARECFNARLLIVCVYRDGEIDVDHPLAATVADMTRYPDCAHLHLRGLSRPEVASLVAEITGRPPAPPLLDRVYGETDGNPFFVGEIVRLLVREGDLDAASNPSHPLVLPRGVRAVISQRLGKLSPACIRLLRSAAVIGREFGVAVLADVTGRATPDLLAELGEAADVDVIEAVPNLLGRFRFAHALIRDTLYQEVGSTERTRLHRRVGAALERLAAFAPDGHLAEIAHHFYEAARGGMVEQALEYAVRAARQALGPARLRGGRRAIHAGARAPRPARSGGGRAPLRAPDRPRRRANAGRRLHPREGGVRGRGRRRAPTPGPRAPRARRARVLDAHAGLRVEPCAGRDAGDGARRPR